MGITKSRFPLPFRIISAIILCVFLCTSVISVEDAHALATWAGLEQVPVRRELEKALLETSSRLIYAEPGSDDEQYLAANNADVLLVDRAKILVRSGFKKTPLKLLRAIIHEETEAVMQVMEQDDRGRYYDLKALMLSRSKVMHAYAALFPDGKVPADLDDNLLLNDIVAHAFELILLRENGLITKSEATPAEWRFCRIVSRIVNDNKHNYFTGIFWDAHLRHEYIRVAVANGRRFRHVASTAKEGEPQPAADPVARGIELYSQRHGGQPPIDVAGTVTTQQAIAEPYRTHLQAQLATHYPTLARLYAELFPEVLPWYIQGMDINYLQHHAVVADFAMEIAIAEGLREEDAAVLLVAALFHDAGNGQTTRTKVTPKQIEEAAGDARAHLAAEAVAFRQEHMEIAARMVAEMLPQHAARYPELLTAASISEIERLVSCHDNLKIPLWQHDANPEWIRQWLVARDDWLLQYLVEADTLWMVTAPGIQSDIDKEGAAARTPAAQLDFNIGLFRQWRQMYADTFGEAAAGAFNFKDGTLLRSDSAGAIYRRLVRGTEEEGNSQPATVDNSTSAISIEGSHKPSASWSARHRVFIVFLSAFAPAVAMLALGPVKIASHHTQMTFWVFAVNAVMALVLFIATTARTRTTSAPVFFAKLLADVGRQGGGWRQYIYLIVPALTNAFIACFYYHIFPHINPDIGLTFLSLGTFVTLPLAYFYNHEKEGWAQKLCGAGIGAIGLGAMLYIAGLSLSNPLVETGIIIGLASGISSPLWRRLYENIYHRDEGPQSELFKNLPAMTILFNYMVGTVIALGSLLIFGNGTLTRFNDASIMNLTTVPLFLAAVSLFMVSWGCTFKLMQMIDYDLSQFAPLNSSGPMMNKVMQETLRGNWFHMHTYLSLIPAALVILGGFIAATGKKVKNVSAVNEIDLHIHSNRDRGNLSPQEIVDEAVAKKMKAIAITDHNTLSSAVDAIRYVAEKNIDLQVIAGFEAVVSDHGIRRDFLIYFPDTDWFMRVVAAISVQMPEPSWTVEDIIRWAHSLRGVIVYAHPLEFDRGGNIGRIRIRELFEAGLDGLEIDHRLFRSWTMHILRSVIDEWNRSHVTDQKIFTIGSDYRTPHYKWHSAEIGVGWPGRKYYSQAVHWTYDAIVPPLMQKGLRHKPLGYDITLRLIAQLGEGSTIHRKRNVFVRLANAAWLPFFITATSAAIFAVLQLFVPETPIVDFLPLQIPFISHFLRDASTIVTLRTCLGFIVFMPLGDLFSQFIHTKSFRKVDGVKLAAVLFYTTLLLSWTLPMTYHLWGDYMPPWMVGLADQIFICPVCTGMVFLVHGFIDAKRAGRVYRVEIAKKSLYKMVPILRVALPYWAVIIGASFLFFPTIAPTVIAVCEPPWVIYQFFIANKNSGGEVQDDSVMRMNWFGKSLLPAVFIFNIILFPQMISVPTVLIGTALYAMLLFLGFEQDNAQTEIAITTVPDLRKFGGWMAIGMGWFGVAGGRLVSGHGAHVASSESSMLLATAGFIAIWICLAAIVWAVKKIFFSSHRHVLQPEELKQRSMAALLNAMIDFYRAMHLLWRFDTDFEKGEIARVSRVNIDSVAINKQLSQDTTSIDTSYDGILRLGREVFSGNPRDMRRFRKSLDRAKRAKANADWMLLESAKAMDKGIGKLEGMAAELRRQGYSSTVTIIDAQIQKLREGDGPFFGLFGAARDSYVDAKALSEMRRRLDQPDSDRHIGVAIGGMARMRLRLAEILGPLYAALESGVTERGIDGGVGPISGTNATDDSSDTFGGWALLGVMPITALLAVSCALIIQDIAYALHTSNDAYYQAMLNRHPWLARFVIFLTSNGIGRRQYLPAISNPLTDLLCTPHKKISAQRHAQPESDDDRSRRIEAMRDELAQAVASYPHQFNKEALYPAVVAIAEYPDWLDPLKSMAERLAGSRIPFCSTLEHGTAIAVREAGGSRRAFKKNLAALEALARDLAGRDIDPLETLIEADRISTHIPGKKNFRKLLDTARQIPALYKHFRDAGYSDGQLARDVQVIVESPVLAATFDDFSEIISLVCRLESRFLEHPELINAPAIVSDEVVGWCYCDGQTVALENARKQYIPALPDPEYDYRLFIDHDQEHYDAEESFGSDIVHQYPVRLQKYRRPALPTSFALRIISWAGDPAQALRTIRRFHQMPDQVFAGELERIVPGLTSADPIAALPLSARTDRADDSMRTLGGWAALGMGGLGVGWERFVPAYTMHESASLTSIVFILAGLGAGWWLLNKIFTTVSLRRATKASPSFSANVLARRTFIGIGAVAGLFAAWGFTAKGDRQAEKPHEQKKKAAYGLISDNDINPARQTVVFIHGAFGGSPDDYQPFVDRFTDNYNVARFSYDESRPLAAIAKDFADAVAKMRTDHALTDGIMIVANSYGTLVAREAIIHQDTSGTLFKNDTLVEVVPIWGGSRRAMKENVPLLGTVKGDSRFGQGYAFIQELRGKKENPNLAAACAPLGDIQRSLFDGDAPGIFRGRIDTSVALVVKGDSHSPEQVTDPKVRAEFERLYRHGQETTNRTITCELLTTTAAGRVPDKHAHSNILKCGGTIDFIADELKAQAAKRGVDLAPVIAAGLLTAHGAEDDWVPIVELGETILLNTTTGRIAFNPTAIFPPSEAEVYAVRHGETDANKAKLFQGMADEPQNQLNEDGRRQAYEAACRLFDQFEARIRAGEEIIVMMSQLGRARDTAQAFIDLVRERIGVIIIPVEEELLNEISFGVWDNKTEEMVPEEQEAINQYRRGLNARIRPSGGMSFIDLLTRARRLWKKLNTIYRGKTVILFGHGTQLSAMRAMVGDRALVDAAGAIDWRNTMLPHSRPTLLSAPVIPLPPTEEPLLERQLQELLERRELLYLTASPAYVSASREFRALVETIEREYHAPDLLEGMDDFYPTEEGMLLYSKRWGVASLFERIGAGPADSLLEVGSAGGALSYFLAHTFGLSATGVEVSASLHTYGAFLGGHLTERGYVREGQVRLVNENFIDTDFSQYSLVYYCAKGAERKQELLEKFRTVKPGCRILIYGVLEPEIEIPLTTDPHFSTQQLVFLDARGNVYCSMRVYARTDAVIPLSQSATPSQDPLASAGRMQDAAHPARLQESISQPAAAAPARLLVPLEPGMRQKFKRTLSLIDHHRREIYDYFQRRSESYYWQKGVARRITFTLSDETCLSFEIAQDFRTITARVSCAYGELSVARSLSYVDGNIARDRFFDPARFLVWQGRAQMSILAFIGEIMQSSQFGQGDSSAQKTFTTFLADPGIGQIFYAALRNAESNLRISYTPHVSGGVESHIGTASQVPELRFFITTAGKPGSYRALTTKRGTGERFINIHSHPGGDLDISDEDRVFLEKEQWDVHVIVSRRSAHELAGRVTMLDRSARAVTCDILLVRDSKGRVILRETSEIVVSPPAPAATELSTTVPHLSEPGYQQTPDATPPVATAITSPLDPEAALAAHWPLEPTEPMPPNPYWDNEKNINRSLNMLDEGYDGAVCAEIDRMRTAVQGKPVRILMVGVGRGFEAFSLMKQYGSSVDITTTNKEDLLYREPAALVKRFADEGIVVTNEEAAELIRRARSQYLACDMDDGFSTAETYDMAIFCAGACEYITKKVPALESVLTVTRDGGAVFCSLDRAWFEDGNGGGLVAASAYFSSCGNPSVEVTSGDGIIFRKDASFSMPHFTEKEVQVLDVQHGRGPAEITTVYTIDSTPVPLVKREVPPVAAQPTLVDVSQSDTSPRAPAAMSIEKAIEILAASDLDRAVQADMLTFARHIQRLGIQPGQKILEVGPGKSTMFAAIILALLGCDVDVIDDDAESLPQYMQRVHFFSARLCNGDQRMVDAIIAHIHPFPRSLYEHLKTEHATRYSIIMAFNVFDLLAIQAADDVNMLWRSLPTRAILICSFLSLTGMQEFVKSAKDAGLEVEINEADEHYQLFPAYNMFDIFISRAGSDTEEAIPVAADTTATGTALPLNPKTAASSESHQAQVVNKVTTDAKGKVTSASIEVRRGNERPAEMRARLPRKRTPKRAAPSAAAQPAPAGVSPSDTSLNDQKTNGGYRVDLYRMGDAVWRAETSRGACIYALEQVQQVNSENEGEIKEILEKACTREWADGTVQQLKSGLRPDEVLVVLRVANKAIGLYYVDDNHLEAISVLPRYRGTGAVDILFQDIIDRVSRGNENAVFNTNIIRKSIRATNGLFNGTIEQLKTAMGIISKVVVHDAEQTVLSSRQTQGDNVISLEAACAALRATEPAEFTRRAVSLGRQAALYQKTGEDLILYVDDLLAGAAIVDLESTLSKALTRYQILHGGKVVLYASDVAHAAVINEMISHADPDIETIVVTEADVQARAGANRSETTEIDAIIRCARSKGLRSAKGNILAVVKHQVVGKESQPEELTTFATDRQMPIILIPPGGVVQGQREVPIYSLADALAKALAMKRANGKKGWVCPLLPIHTFSDQTDQRYLDYLHSLEARIRA